MDSNSAAVTVLKVRHSAVSTSTGMVPDSCTGTITFDNVNFAYPTRTKEAIFEGVNFTADAGTSVAIAGQSGCGKSSVLRLLQRNYNPSAGTVRLDGVDISQINTTWLRGQIGVVAQEPVLFSGSVEDNIRAGRKGIAQERVHAAAKLADAHAFIMKMKEGYKTPILEGGSSLSGGQKQRVAIARAILSDPKILLFDEATSALDRNAAAEIQKAIASVSKGRTSLTVAHNVAAIRDADVIHVLEGKKVAESGSHDELNGKQDGAFQRLFSTNQ
jgi:ATP-binding cassette, subfamily B (MDR/TAP), member 1